MTVPRYVARAFAGWQAWWFKTHEPERRERLYRALPALRDLDRRQGEIARQHRPGARKIERQRRAVMTERLRLEVQHG